MTGHNLTGLPQICQGSCTRCGLRGQVMRSRLPNGPCCGRAMGWTAGNSPLHATDQSFTSAINLPPIGIFGAENLVSFVDLFFEAGFMFINKQNSSYFHVSINVEPSRSRPSCTEAHHIYRSCCRCIWRCAAWPVPCLRWNDAPDGLRQGRSPECRSLRNVGTLLSIHLQAKLFSKHQTSTQLIH